jgi:anthranilate phosphoribosyltransferase
MDITEVIREIGRGKHGARSISASKAQMLFEAIFAQSLAPEALGAVLMAFRMKGETVDELIGALSAAQAFTQIVPTDHSRPVVAIPSYNGARNMANLTPLLACLLSDAGVQVVVHGVRTDSKRITTAQIMAAMGHELLNDVAQAPDLLARNEPVFVPIDVLSPALDRVLGLRQVLGVRNTAHSIVKLLDPCARPDSVRMVSYTHPEFDQLQHQLFATLGAPAVIMRGTEGEVVANAKRQARINWVCQGQTTTLVQADTQPLREVPLLPPAHDVAATAGWIQSVLAGERAVPALIEQQVLLILRQLGLGGETHQSLGNPVTYSGPILTGIPL